IGDPSVQVSRVATLSGADEFSVSFLSAPAYRQLLTETRAAAVILRAADADICPVNALVSSNPYLLYARIATVLHPPATMPPGVHASAVVAASAIVAASAHVAAHTVIGDNCAIGDRAIVGPGCVIGMDCRIGEGTRLAANVTLGADVSIGSRCIVHPGAVIGSDGFGNAMSETGWMKVPQVGGVRIGDDVEIGANATIDRGAIDHTIIENGVRLDNLVQIAHNVRIGEHTAMAAMTGVSGSTVIGKRCMFAGQTGIVGHLSICDDVIVTGKTMISKNIDKPGTYSSGFPAEESGTWKRQVARFRRLDMLSARLSALEARKEKE
ncbi:MAG TPA: UDP-3-O-(3-hydroxymyristoyl)glucosamine N-acyltransferase, partial [Woeseiaceae bacterium]